MRPLYIDIAAGVPKVVPVDYLPPNMAISIRTDATTVEVTLENVLDPAAPTPVWVAAPAAGGNGIIVIRDPCMAVRFSKATAGKATLLQQSIR